MASGSINLDSVIPQEYELEIPTSSSASILRKSLVGSYPTRIARYQPYGNNWMEFNVYSPTEFLLLKESYFRWDITRTDLNGGQPSNQYDNAASLDRGGIHCIVKTFQVNSGGTATRLDENLLYNTFSSNFHKFTHTPHEKNHVLAHEAQSVHGERGWNNQDQRNGFYLKGLSNFTAATWANNTLVLNQATNAVATTYVTAWVNPFDVVNSSSSQLGTKLADQSGPPPYIASANADYSYSMILPPMYLNQIGRGTSLDGTVVPWWLANVAYAVGDYILFPGTNTGIDPLSSVGAQYSYQGYNALEFFPNTTATRPSNLSILPKDDNGNLGFQIVQIPSLWQCLVNHTPTTWIPSNWKEIPFSSLNQINDSRKNLQRGDVLDIEVYNCTMSGKEFIQQVRVEVIAVDQLTGIIFINGNVPVNLYANAAPTYVAGNVTYAQGKSELLTYNVITILSASISGTPGNKDVVTSVVNYPAQVLCIKSIFVSQRPLPINSVPGRMEVIRYNNVRYRVLWRPENTFFDLDWPLFVSKNGLNFKIEIDFGDRCMVTGLTSVASQNQLDYVIDDPKFYGYYSAPDPSLMRDVVNKWNSADGLIYYVPTYTYRELSGVFGEQDTFLNFQPGVRSARGLVLFIMSSDISSVNTALSRASKSLSTCLRTGVRSFQCNVGAHYFPIEKIDLRENAQVPDYLANEAYHHMFKWVNSRHGNLRKEEFRPWNSIYNSTTNSTCFQDADSFIIYIDLSRSCTPNSALTGVDVSITPLQVRLERGEIQYGASNDVNGLYAAKTSAGNVIVSQFSGAPGYPLYRAFILHDKFIRNSSSVLTALQ